MGGVENVLAVYSVAACLLGNSVTSGSQLASNKIANKKIGDFHRKSTNPSGSGQSVFYVDGKFIREGKITEVNKNHIAVVDQRYVGKYIIWVLQDGNKIRTAVLGKKGFDNFSSNDPDDLKKLWNLTKKFKGKPIPDIATEGTCGYGEICELGEEPAGPHLIKKKLKEAKETIFDVAKRVMKDKQAYGYKTKKGLVTVDVQTANLLTKVFKKVNPKMKKILSDLGYKSPTQLMNTLWAVVK